jgi:TolB-like protein/Tfp pilus assembly protein PilF/tRNA A-37 threonylcarbamoyl transferase component Bud32
MTDALTQPVPDLVGAYTIERELGRGGMATVFLARDLKHHRLVAVKALHPHLSHVLGPDRFRREIELLAGLTHPHIVPLHDSGGTASLLWYTMPYVDGESLRHRLEREGRIPLPDALRITAEVADALDYAHGRGVVHRDLKPENILLSAGHAFVADFGIARALTQADDRLTGTGLALGTPAYMSPEQAAGEQSIDARSDVFSLGCVVYEMLVGEPPFTGPTPQAVLARRITGSAPPLRARRPDLPESIAAAVAGALARDPDARFSTAGAFANRLGEHSSGIDATVVAHAPAVGASSPIPGVRSIAVLPFTDMSAERDQEYLADGIAEEIISALTRVGGLRVAARTSSFAFKGRSEDIGGIGRKLKVSSILEGSLRKAGNRLRVTAQLVDVDGGYQLWSERYDRELADVFAIQDDIAGSVVGALAKVMGTTTVPSRSLERPRTENVHAYEYYLRGRQLFHQFRKRQIQLARRMFERAIELDPRFTLAHAGAADCSSILYMYFEATELNLREADAASRRALELGPDSAEAHAARGLALTLSGSFEAAQREFESAIALDPSLYETWYFYARVCFQKGQMEEAARFFEQAAALRPDDYQAPAYLSMTYDAMGRIEESRAASRRALPILEQHLELYPDDARAWYSGATDLSRLGEREKALQWVDRALSLDPSDGAVLYGIACVYGILGEKEKALDALEKGIKAGFGRREWAEKDPDLASLRGLPRFQKLLESLPSHSDSVPPTQSE